MKFIIAPGAFKHAASADAVAHAIERGLRRSGIQAEYHRMPIADGGNSTVDAWLARGGERIPVQVRPPIGDAAIDAYYGILPDGETAIIEMALASGIELVPDDQRNPYHATTYGTGQLLQHALRRGAKRIIIGMGGSATVDGGAGALQALGVRLLNAQGDAIAHGAHGLDTIAHIDASQLDARWHDVEIIIASDVDNPLLGDDGASAVFAPQKGASPADIPILEAHLTHFADQLQQHLGVDVRPLSGGGAAGGLSAGLLAVLGGRITSGIDLLLDYHAFEDTLRHADLLITGEGRMDEQTIHGKGPIGVAQRAHRLGVPTVALVGGLAVDDVILHQAGLHAVLPIVNAPMTLADAIDQVEQLIEQTALRLGYLLQLKFPRA